MLHTSIPIVAAGVLALTGSGMFSSTPRIYKWVFLIALLFPFYLADAKSDWDFTYFDAKPRHLNAVLDRGFGKGIKTNLLYKRLYDWVLDTSHRYTRQDDFIISYITSPMVYMIAHRRPALDHTFTDFYSRPPEFFEDSIKKMIRMGKRPAAAYRFDRYPALRPMGKAMNRYTFFLRQTDLYIDDPITRYVNANMVCVERIMLGGDFVARFYVDRGCLSWLLGDKRRDNPTQHR